MFQQLFNIGGFEMMMFLVEISTTELYIIFGVLAAISLTLFFLFRYYNFRVEGTSEMLRSLDALNQSYKFHKGIKKSERRTRACNSKQQFERTELSEYLASVILDNVEYYDTLMDKIDTNRLLYKEYLNEYQNLQSTASKEIAKKNMMPLFIYKSIEKRMASKRKLTPRTDTEFIVKATYTSPKGKNNYHKTYIYNVSQVKAIIENVHRQIERKKTKEYQRMIMSDALRYDVLHRDGFKCQLCGASMKDGVKLHVDHIIPIAKGGKTEMSNLRTLCERCNIGKGSKTERND